MRDGELLVGGSKRYLDNTLQEGRWFWGSFFFAGAQLSALQTPLFGYW